MREINSRFSEWASVIGGSLLIILVPFGWWQKDPYGLIKWTLIGMVALVIFATWLASSLLLGRFHIRRNSTNLPLLVLLGWASLSFWISPHRYYFWNRFYEILCLVLIYFALVSNLAEKRAKLFLVASSLIGLFFISVLGITQYAGLLKIDSPWGTGLGKRIYATMLNPNFLAAYIVSLLPMALAFLTFSCRLRWTFIILVVVVLSAFLCLLFTVSWGGWFGCLLSIVVLVFFTMRRAKRHARTKRLIVILAAFILITASFLYINRGTVVSDYSGMKFRLLYWRASIAMIMEKPFIGSGLNSFEPNVSRYLTEIIATDYRDGIPNDEGVVTVYEGKYAHNEYIAVWLEMGFIGLAFFIWFILRFFYQGLRNLKEDGDPTELAINLGALCGVVAMLLQSVFSYPLRLPATSVSLAILLAFIGSGSATGVRTYRFNPVTAVKYLLVVIVIGCTLYLLPRLTYPLIGEKLYVEARLASAVGKWVLVREKCLAALNYSVTEPKIFDLLGETNERLGLTNEAVRAFQSKLELKPYNSYAYLKLGILYNRLGMEDRAIYCFKKAIELERHDSTEARLLLAEIVSRDGSWDDAMPLLKSGLSRHRRDWKLRNLIGIAYTANGEWDKASDEFLLAIDFGGGAVPKYNLRLLKYSEGKGSIKGGFLGPAQYDWINKRLNDGRLALKRGNLERGRVEFEEVLRVYPNYVPAISNLGIYHLKKNQMENALKLWERAKSIDREYRLDIPL